MPKITTNKRDNKKEIIKTQDIQIKKINNNDNEEVNQLFVNAYNISNINIIEKLNIDEKLILGSILTLFTVNGIYKIHILNLYLILDKSCKEFNHYFKENLLDMNWNDFENVIRHLFSLKLILFHDLDLYVISEISILTNIEIHKFNKGIKENKEFAELFIFFIINFLLNIK